MNILSGIESTSAALDAERLRMEVISQNIANANTTKGPDGKPYQRQQVSFESVINGHLTGNSAPLLFGNPTQDRGSNLSDHPCALAALFFSASNRSNAAEAALLSADFLLFPSPRPSSVPS